MSRVRKIQGFTLFELLLVLLIIVSLYGLFAQNFNFKTQEDKNIKIERLNQYLVDNFSQNGELVSLICIENSDECRVLVDNEDNNITLNVFEKNGEISSYIYDGKRLEKMSFDDYYIDDYKRERVSFKMDIYPNQSNERMVLKYENMVVLFDNFFNENRVFQNIEEAQEFLYKFQHEARGR